MDEPAAIEPDVLPAGDFGEWLDATRGVLAGRSEADVPCGGCTGCCTSSQFVHVEPDEVEALARIPVELRFPAPGLPAGHVVLGYDEQGRCPMLGDGGCTIYEHRPRTCRTYDCRVFPATGIAPDRPDIAERTVRWRFSYRRAADRARHDDLVASTAAAQVATGAQVSPTERAVLAVRWVGEPRPRG